MNKLALPNQVQIGAQFQPGPNAVPASIQVSGPGVAQTIVFGGYTKLEDAAVKVASGMVASAPYPLDAEFVARRSREIAEAVLAECNPPSPEAP